MSALDALERRLEALEDAVFGADETQRRHVEDDFNAVERLLTLAKAAGNAAEQRPDRIAPVLKRVHDLDRLVDPNLAEEQHLMDEDAKYDLVLAQEDKLRRTARLLEKVAEAEKTSLDKAFVNDGLEAKLKTLTMLHLDQTSKADRVTKESLELMSRYNDLVKTISETFAGYELIVRKAEHQKAKK